MAIGNDSLKFQLLQKYLRIIVFLEVEIIVKQLNQIFGIDRVCQSMITKSSPFKVHLKPYEEKPEGILHACKQSCIKLVYD